RDRVGTHGALPREQRGRDLVARLCARDLPPRGVDAGADAGQLRRVRRARQAPALFRARARHPDRPRHRRAARVERRAGRLSGRTPRGQRPGSPRLLTPNFRMTADVSHGAWRCRNTSALPCPVTTTSRRRRAIARTICRAARAVDMIRNPGMGSGVSSRRTPSLSTRRISEATNPGLASVTDTPALANSWPSASASARTANLLIAYGDDPGVARWPLTLPMMATRPRARRTSASVALSVRRTPKTLVSNWRR